jgi:serine-type D-Ala-D-Ala carboxypeptidase/endopeptidase (penicillin-binding protein 4)
VTNVRRTLILAFVFTALWMPAGCSLPARDATLATSSPATRPAAESLRQRLDGLFEEAKYANAYWGVRVERLNGEVVYDHLGHKEFAPASNMKLLTTACALDTLGANFTYETRVEAVGDIRPDGTLNGHLLIVGSGDPSLGAWHPDKTAGSAKLLADWAAKIKAAGITRIQGDIIGDGRCFTADHYSPAWTYGDLPYWYATGTSGLAIEENAFRCIIRPAEAVGAPATIEVIPKTSYITILNQTCTVAAGQPCTADSTWQQAEGNTRRFVGAIARDKKQMDDRGAVWDGPRYAAHLLAEELERDGVKVGGYAINIRNHADAAQIDNFGPEQRKVLARVISPPMSELVKVVNKPSHNFFADQILRTLGARKLGEGSFEAGAKVVKAWLKDIGAPQPETVQMFDGSGLARDDFVQPRQICCILRHMQSSKAAAVFVESLPIAAEDGTLETRMTGPSTKGKVHAKTGYISNVRALSGYVPNAAGETLVFSMICNGYTVPTREVNVVQDKAVEMLAALNAQMR